VSSGDAAGAAILALLARRRGGASICPSEAARALDPNGWRARMTEVHAAARALAAADEVELARGGAALPARAAGVYRIRRPSRT
jgi:hypothetical protein